MGTDWSLQLDHLKLYTGNIETHLLEFDHIMITSPTHCLLGTDTDMYRHNDKAIEKCNNYFGNVIPSSHPSFCLSTWHNSNEQDWSVRKLALQALMKICKCIPILVTIGQK
jgi:hypothetical protein